MRRNRIFSLMFSAAAVAGTLSLSSCSNYDFMSEEEINNDLTVKEFTQNFEARYGKIDPNHTWGFGEMEVVNIGGGATRADGDGGVGSVYVRTNEWVNPTNDEYIAGTVQIPGWPSFDGYYYGNNGSGKGTPSSSVPSDQNIRPCGDVTDYEIQYVSEFFRSHNKTQLKKYEQELHLTDFFIQNVSAENDRESYPNGALKSTILGDGCNFGMEYLVFKTMESNANIDETWTHMNNYNRSNTSLMTENNVYYSQGEIDYAKGIKNERPEYMTDEYYNYYCGIAEKTTSDIKVGPSIDSDYKSGSSAYSNDNTNWREIKYVTSSGTEDFGYQSTWTTDRPFFKEWVLVRLTWTEIGQDGEPHEREGYYLAFDYEAQKDGQKYGPDGYYSNWIVKITPAFGNTTVPNNPRRRIMCEDLGNTDDFDFNDVVFDVYLAQNNKTNQQEAVITLQAAGGTLPIYVGKDATNANYEAHNMMGGNSSRTPLNVGGTSAPVAIYRIPYSGTNLDELHIYVVNGQTYEISSHRANLDKYNGGQKGSAAAPQKFCVPTTVGWMKERVQIETSYTKFSDYVTNEDDNATTWYNTIANPGNIINSVGSSASEETSGGEQGGNSGNTDPYAATYGTKILESGFETVSIYGTEYKMIKVSELPTQTFTLNVVYYKQDQNNALGDCKLKKVNYITENSYWEEQSVFLTSDNQPQQFSSTEPNNGVFVVTFPNINYTDIKNYTYLKYEGQNMEDIVGFYIQ